MRIDKWLWAARFFKTRAIASRACEMGRVQSGELDAKPSREVRVGDKLHIRTDAGTFHVEVLSLNAMRGPAAVAQTMYFESEESREARAQAAEERRRLHEAEGLPPEIGRPSKRNRRTLDRLRGRF